MTLAAAVGVVWALTVAGLGACLTVGRLWAEWEHEHLLWKLSMQRVHGLDDRCRDHHLETGP